MKCLDLSQLVAYKYRFLNDSELHKIEQHLQSCPSCQRMISTYENFFHFVRDSLYKESSSTENCPDDHEWLSYLQDKRKNKSQKRLYLHLSQCQSCLSKLVAYKKLLTELENEGLLEAEKAHGQKTSELFESIRAMVVKAIRSIREPLRTPVIAYRWIGVAVVLIAAGIALFKITNMQNFPITTRELRTDQYRQNVQLNNPADKITVQDLPEFRWIGPLETDYFIFLLLDADGEIIWKQKTHDTSLTLPQEVKLQPAMTYFWQVEGYYKIGGSVLSDMNRFVYKTD
jgi:hypothetical protein